MEDQIFGEFVEEWGHLIFLILTFGLIFLGLTLSLYNDFSTHSLIKSYLYKTRSTNGEILSCETTTPPPPQDGVVRMEISILYTALANKYANNARLRFRYPDALEEKRYMRRIHVIQENNNNNMIPRGTNVEVLYLPGRPRSGLPRFFVDETLLLEYSHLRTALFLIPGTCLLAVILLLIAKEAKQHDDDDDDKKNNNMTWLVVMVGIGLVVALSIMFADRRWQRIKERRFNSAVPMKTVVAPTTSEKKTDALLLS